MLLMAAEAPPLLGGCCLEGLGRPIYGSQHSADGTLTLFASSCRSIAKFTNLHEDAMSRHTALVVRLEDKEIVFAPAKSNEGEAKA